MDFTTKPKPANIDQLRYYRHLMDEIRDAFMAEALSSVTGSPAKTELRLTPTYDGVTGEEIHVLTIADVGTDGLAVAGLPIAIFKSDSYWREVAVAPQDLKDLPEHPDAQRILAEIEAADHAEDVADEMERERQHGKPQHMPDPEDVVPYDDSGIAEEELDQ